LIDIPYLAARGKTHVSRSLERYLRWLGVKTRCYSLGDYRRKVLGAAEKIPADYFVPGEKSEETKALRRRIKDGIEGQVWDFFSSQGGQVVIYDANNCDKASRKELLEKFEARGVHVIFLGESPSLGHESRFPSP
jgi:6-phosphofructo-2-kinase/fructose-2,6-biphosphatase 4